MSTEAGRRWWRTKRLPDVEAKAYRLIGRYERRFGRIGSLWLPVSHIVEGFLGYEVVYDAPEKYNAPCDALAVLLPELKLIVQNERETEYLARENQNYGHEICHIECHLPAGFGNAAQLTMGGLIETTEPSHIHCRVTACDGCKGADPPWAYREAEFFAACLQLPRERFGPIAEERLREALRSSLKSWNVRLQDLADDEDLQAAVNTAAVRSAGERLYNDDYRRNVGRRVQTIRLAELGLVRQLTRSEAWGVGEMYALGDRVLSPIYEQAGLELPQPRLLESCSAATSMGDPFCAGVGEPEE